MAKVTAGPRAGPLRTGLAMRLALLVAVAVTFTGWASLAVSRRVLESRFDSEMEGRTRAMKVRLAAAGTDLEGVVTLAREHLAGDLRLLEPLLGERPAAADLAARHVVAAELAQRFRLPVLEILDSGGSILSSAHWPEQAGSPDPAAESLPAGRACWVVARLPAGEALARVVREPVTLGSRRLDLVGGRPLDRAWLAELTGGAAAAWVPGRGAVVSTVAPEQADAFRAAAREDGQGRVAWPDGSMRAIRSLDVASATGERLGRFVIAVDRSTFDASLGRLRWTFGGLVVAGILAGAVAGSWLARRATRPVEETIRAIDAITAGDADHDFPHASRDGLGALTEAFSRMQRSLEDQQRRRVAAERAAAWKEVARRVAHEVKNPLAPIRLTMENLVKARRRAPEMFDGIFEEGSRAILEEVDQLQRIVTEFSELARLPEPRPARTDLDAVVDSVLALHAGEPGLRVDRVRGDGSLAVLADADLLSRAIKNLVANAIEAMGERGGTLRVETGRRADAAFVRIGDTGPGFSAEALERLFEPYFTTKSSGTGLGMAIAHRIVTEQGGSVTASNRPGGGAEVVVELGVVR